MELLKSCHIQCPYCWQIIEINIDCSLVLQEYIEDCQVCCNPITLDVRLDSEGQPTVNARQEDA